MTPALSDYLEELFDLRYRIARVGESDWLGWWESEALSGPGLYAMERLFRRTPRLTAAHVSILAARARHDQVVPKEDLVHLFNFGETFEGEFERWLIDRKADGWDPPELPEAPPDGASSSTESAFVALELPEEQGHGDAEDMNGLRVLGTIESQEMEEPVRRREIAGRLASAYRVGGPGELVVPYFRIQEA